MPRHQLRFRQVHLDFHTAGQIPGIGTHFNKNRFQEALQLGHVDSITLFAKCHHGYSYHPTKIGRQHPHLKFDLLSAQIEACREIDVRCPIYISAGFDEYIAAKHPEWLVKNRDGTTADPFHVGWKVMNFDTDYLDYLCDQIEEVAKLFRDNDGIFLDIIHPRKDYSPSALEKMRKLGLDPECVEDVKTYGQRVLLNYYQRTTAAARSVNKDTTVFHNGGHIPIGARRFNIFNSHLELESLPTGGWGYDHFPFSARYAITQPRDFLGMTGKFHTSWGEFGGFKRSAALRFECGAMLAYGAKCSVGDQLHPNGEMNIDTYRLIGDAYAEVESKEPWCDSVKPVANIALVSAEHDQDTWRRHGNGTAADEGASRMLLEMHLPFVVLDANASWAGYDLVILPDQTKLTDKAISKAEKHISKGGKIIAAGSSLLNAGNTDFAIDPGAKLLGRSRFVTDFLQATKLTPDAAVKSPTVIHGGCFEIQLKRGARILVERRIPFFNRTWDHFCSHQHAPDSPEEVSPAAVISKNIAYFAHDLFTAYRELGQPLYRDFFAAAVDRLVDKGRPVNTGNFPSSARINIMEQKKERRYIIHLLYAPTRVAGSFHGKPIEIIEDLVELHDINVEARLPRSIKSARLVPENTDIDFSTSPGRVKIKVPRFTGHQMIELAY